MQFTSSFVTLTIAVYASLALAAPTSPAIIQRADNGKSKNAAGKNTGKNTATKAAAGAVYFMTNDPQNNFVVATEIGSNGKLGSAFAFQTGGRGLHGNADAIGPDPLFSQGSVKVLGNNLFAVNTGSNTISMFAIDPNSPTRLRAVGGPVSSQGEFPASLAVSAASGNVCVLNGGQFNSVACFKVDQAVGLVPINNSFRQLGLNQTAGAPTGPPGTVSHVLFNKDGSKLIASVKGVPPNPGFLAVWDVAGDGSLSANFKAVTPPTGGLLPFGMANVAAGGAATVLVTDPGVGFDVIDVEEALAGAGNGTTAIASVASTNIVAAGRSSANKVDGQVAVCWAAFSQATGNFYMTDIGTNQVTEVNIDATTLKATIAKQYALGNGIATIDDEVATIGGKDFLYVLAANSTSIEVMSLAAPGAAQRIQTFRFRAGKSGSVNIDANNLQGMAAFFRK